MVFQTQSFYRTALQVALDRKHSNSAKKQCGGSLWVVPFPVSLLSSYSWLRSRLADPQRERKATAAVQELGAVEPSGPEARQPEMGAPQPEMGAALTPLPEAPPMPRRELGARPGPAALAARAPTVGTRLRQAMWRLKLRWRAPAAIPARSSARASFTTVPRCRSVNST